MFWYLTPRADASSQCRDIDCTNCRKKAFSLFDGFKEQMHGNFPLFWRLIEFKRDHLATIFEFFCRMEQLLMDTPTELMKFLGQRLKNRFKGEPLPPPNDLEALIKYLTAAQIRAFRYLDGLKLTESAFELFAAGALTDSRRQVLVKGDLAHSDFTRESYPEPNSAAYFYWVEFAFLAVGASHDTEEWKKIICTLLRTERIFALCYGNSKDGKIPESNTFETYGDPTTPFSTIHPDEAKKIPYPTCNQFEELEAEARRCAMFAFPGGIE